MINCLFFLFIFFISFSSYAKDIVFGFYPYDLPTKMYKDFQPLKDYLERKVGVNIKVYFSPKYVKLIKDFGDGKIDVALLGPTPYVKIKDKFGNAEILVKEKLENDEIEKIVFISNVKSKIDSFDDLKGKSFAFGDFQSCGTHFYPRYILHMNGITLTDFKYYDFLVSHSKVILAVSHGDFDAGAARLNIYNQYKNDKTKIFAGPFKIAPHVIVARSGLDKYIKLSIKKALLSLSDRKILNTFQEKLIGFDLVEDSVFDEMREIIKLIEGK